MAEAFEDPVIAEAIVDRLLNPSQEDPFARPKLPGKIARKLPTGKTIEKENLLK